MTQNTETDIHIYNRPSRSLTESAPTSNRRTATEDGEHAENTLENSPKLAQIRK